MSQLVTILEKTVSSGEHKFFFRHFFLLNFKFFSLFIVAVVNVHALAFRIFVVRFTLKFKARLSRLLSHKTGFLQQKPRIKRIFPLDIKLQLKNC